MKTPAPSEPAANRRHTQGGLPCWCGYQGMGILTDREPRFARRDDEVGLYRKGKR